MANSNIKKPITKPAKPLIDDTFYNEEALKNKLDGLKDDKKNVSKEERRKQFSATAKSTFKRETPKLAKSAFKGAMKGAGALTVGALGLAAGIAYGDASKAFQYTATGGGIGLAAGEGLAKRGIKAGESFAKDASDTYKENKYGSNYSEYKRTKDDIKFVKDAEKRKLYRDELGLKTKEEVDKAMSDAIKFREWGVTDDKTIIKAMKLKEEKYGREVSLQEKIRAAKIAQMTGGDNEKLAKQMERVASNNVPEKVRNEIVNMVHDITD